MSSNPKKEKRGVPHINVTPKLQESMEAYVASVPPNLRVNPGDSSEVRAALAQHARSFEDPAFFYGDETASEEKAVDHLIHLATLYLEHLKAGNLPT